MPDQTYSDDEIREAAGRVFHRLADWDAELQAFWLRHSTRLDENKEDLDILDTTLNELWVQTWDMVYGRSLLATMRKYLRRVQFGLALDGLKVMASLRGSGNDIRRLPPNLRKIRDRHNALTKE